MPAHEAAVTEAAITVDGVSKSFRLVRRAPTTLKQRLIGRGGRETLLADELRALQDVSLRVPSGTSLGLIGPNGSGKTTLLKIIAGILRPTSGSVTTRGRVAPLLELGAGFHPELTGRENVYLNAAILGLSTKQTDAVLDDVIGFADIDGFVDSKVKFYSSGMYMRLGFAIAVHADPEILLVDEVLAVGDEGFQRRCLDRIRTFQQEGRTIVLVTHVVDHVRQICTQGVMLVNGRVQVKGSPDEVVQAYRRLLLGDGRAWSEVEPSGAVSISAVEVIPPDGRTPFDVRPGDDLTVQLELHANAPVDDADVFLQLHDAQDAVRFRSSAAELGSVLGRVAGRRRVRFTLRWIPFTSGSYGVTVGVTSRDGTQVHAVAERAASFSIGVQPGRQALAHIETNVEIEG